MLSPDTSLSPALTRVGTTLLALALLGAMVLIFGCRGSEAPADVASDTPEQGIIPDPAEPPGETGEASPLEQAATPRLTLPDDFPPTVPLIPQRQIRSLSPREEGSFSLTYAVPIDRREAADYYREHLAELGWEVTLDSLSGGMTTISARQVDDSRLTVNIIENPAEQQTMIGLYHRPPKQGIGG